MRYEDTVRKICGDDWRDTSPDEKDGAYGVACMLAYLDGVKLFPGDLAKSIDVMSAHLTAPYDDIETAMRRLMAAGLFSNRFNARRDQCLNGYSSAQDGRTAWCFIAGSASGYVGQGYHIQRQIPKSSPNNVSGVK